MFGFTKINRPNTCPIPEDNRVWLENSFLLLSNMFGKEETQKRKVLVPHHSDFPVKYTGDEPSAFDTLRIIAKQMEISYDDIHLDFYDDTVKEISTGSPLGTGIFLRTEKDDAGASGLYWGKREDGKYEISLVRSKLAHPENMVATLAHELSHIKLLGENRLETNDEKLTDWSQYFSALEYLMRMLHFKLSGRLALMAGGKWVISLKWNGVMRCHCLHIFAVNKCPNGSTTSR